MSYGQDATASPEPSNPAIKPIVEVLCWNDNADNAERDKVSRMVNEALSAGRAVAISPVYADRHYTWSEESINRLICGPNSTGAMQLNWQSAYHGDLYAKYFAS